MPSGQWMTAHASSPLDGREGICRHDLRMSQILLPGQGHAELPGQPVGQVVRHMGEEDHIERHQHRDAVRQHQQVGPR